MCSVFSSPISARGWQRVFAAGKSGYFGYFVTNPLSGFRWVWGPCDRCDINLITLEMHLRYHETKITTTIVLGN